MGEKSTLEGEYRLDWKEVCPLPAFPFSHSKKWPLILKRPKLHRCERWNELVKRLARKRGPEHVRTG